MPDPRVKTAPQAKWGRNTTKLTWGQFRVWIKLAILGYFPDKNWAF
jgi:hypothetical protein